MVKTERWKDIVLQYLSNFDLALVLLRKSSQRFKMSFKFKHKVYSTCLELTQSKIDLCEKELTLLNASQNSETKSSMGDKYETSREMMQRERDNLLATQHTHKTAIGLLHRLDIEKTSTIAELGSYIETDKASYFLCIGLGKIEVDGIAVNVVSMQSPIGKALIGKKPLETFVFNGLSSVIQKIF